MSDEFVSIPSVTPKGFEFIRASDLISNVKPISWAIHKILEANSLGLLFGDPESGKSLLAKDMGLCTAADLEWHGHRANQGAVFCIDGEGHNGTARRISAWSIRHKQAVDSLPFYVSECAASLYNYESAVEVCDAIQSLATQSGENPVLIIIDTLARNFGPASENSTEDMNQFIAHVDKIREQFKAAVLIVHHTGHGDKSRARGAYALTGAMDAEYRLEKGDDDIVRMTCTKAKDFSRPEPLAFKIRPVELGIEDEDGEPVVSVVLDLVEYSESTAQTKGLGRSQRQALQVLQEMYHEYRRNRTEGGHDPEHARVTLTDWKAQLEGQNLLGKYSRQNFNKVKNGLLEAGQIRMEGMFVYPAGVADA